MKRTQKINFNESLLFHSLSKSDANSSHRSLNKKSCSSLLSELNMTYSRLTFDTKYDRVKENFPDEREIEYEFQNELETQIQEIFPEKQFCPNCKMMKQQLFQVESFLVEFQRKFIQKEILLADKYKTITNLLDEKSQELIRCQNYCKKLKREISLLKGVNDIPKLDLNISPKHCNNLSLSSDTAKHCINTIESTKASDNRNPRHLLKNSTYLSRCQKTGKQKDDCDRNITESDSINKILTSSLDFSYTESEIQYSSVIDRLKSGKTQRNGHSFFKTQNNHEKQNSLNKDYELSKLMFENSSLKSYNSVLLEHVKPRSLVDKVFLIRKN